MKVVNHKNSFSMKKSFKICDSDFFEFFNLDDTYFFENLCNILIYLSLYSMLLVFIYYGRFEVR
jgi:hypothetical protein